MGQKVNINSSQVGIRSKWNNVTLSESKMTTTNAFLSALLLKSQTSDAYDSLNQKPSHFRLSFVNGQIAIYCKLLNQRYFSPIINSHSVDTSRNLVHKHINQISSNLPNTSHMLQHLNESSKLKSLRLNFLPGTISSSRRQFINSLMASSLSGYIINQLSYSPKHQDILFKQSLFQSLLKLSKLLMTVTNNTNLLGLKIQIKGKWMKTKTGRKQKILVNIGKITKDGNNSAVSFSSLPLFTKFGSTGIKVWVSYKH